MIDLGKITQGERGTITFAWEFPDGLTSPATIMGATITATAKNLDTGDVTTITGALTGTAATTVTWALSAGDSGTAGTYAIVFRAVVSGTATYTLDAALDVQVNPSATATQNPPLVGVSADEAAWLSVSEAGGALGTAAYEDVLDLPFDTAGAAASAQAAAVQRANHTGTQAAATISDFNTAAQTSAQALLAAAVVSVGTTGAETEITLSTKNTAADWKIRTWSAIYDGTRDDTFNISYNYDAAHVDLTRAGMTLQLESDYDYGVGHASELIYQWVNPAGTVNRRPIQINVEYADGAVFTQMKGRLKLQNSESTLDTFEVTELGAATFGSRVAATAYDLLPNVPFIHEETGYSVGVGRDTITTPPASGGAVAIGFQAGKTATGARGVYVGYDAGNKTTGDGNIHIGYEAGKANTTGINILIGDRAGVAMVGATANTAVGYDALKSDVSNHLNTAMGYSAMRATTGALNTAVGAFAGDGGGAISNAAYFGYYAGKYETATGKLIIDTIDRTNEALSRSRALIYGVFNSTVGSQELTFNCGKMGFFNTAAVAKPTGVAVDAAGIHAALVTLGLIAA